MSNKNISELATDFDDGLARVAGIIDLVMFIAAYRHLDEVQDDSVAAVLSLAEDELKKARAAGEELRARAVTVLARKEASNG